MLLAVLFSLFAAVFAVKNGQSKCDPSKKCARKLQEIVYYPDNCAFKYLKRISAELIAETPLLFSSQVKTVVQEFETKYQVAVQFFNPFGQKYDYLTGSLIPDDFAYAFTLQRSAALGSAFAEGYGDVAHSFVIRNEDGEMYTIRIILPKVNAPSFCC